MNAEFYKQYKTQNPAKYAIKYGEKTPEELAGIEVPASPEIEGPVKVVMNAPKEIEMEFKPEPDIITPVVKKKVVKKK
jgi:hypothetical protein